MESSYTRLLCLRFEGCGGGWLDRGSQSHAFAHTTCVVEKEGRDVKNIKSDHNTSDEPIILSYICILKKSIQDIPAPSFDESALNHPIRPLPFFTPLTMPLPSEYR